MSKTLRIGSVGTSSIMKLIQESIHLTDGLEAGVVYSRDEARGKAFAREAGVPEACSSYADMIGRDDLDIIYIASPNVLHCAQAVEALRAGKHVIVEKPAAVTAGEVQEMYEAAKAGGVFFLEAITTLFMPNYLALKQLLPELGDICKAEFAYGQYSSKYDAYLRGENPNIFNPAMQGGALNDMGIYCIHAVVDLFGEPEGVRYEAERGENGVDLKGTLCLEYPGLTVHVYTSKKDTPEMGNGVLIEGERGVLRQSGPFNEFPDVSACVDGAERPLAQQPAGNRMVYEHAAFRDCILAHDEEFFERMYRQSLACARILERAAKS